MATTEKVTIWVQERGAKATSRAMKGLAASMVVVGYTALRVGKNLTEAADSYTNLTNRTKVFAKSQESAAYRMQETIRIARETHSSIDSISQIVQRVSLAQASTGMGDEQLVKVAENLSKAAMLSGASGQEAEGALRQFTQGLAANRLAGQELNSVLEQTPLVAQMIADEMDVPIGSLRALAEQGRLTSAMMIEVFGKDSEKLNAMMDGWDWPIEAMFTDLQREWKLGVGKFAKDSGLEGAFKEKLVSIKETFQSMMEAMSDPTVMENVKAGIDGLVGAFTALGIAAMAVSLYFGGWALIVGGLVVGAIALTGAIVGMWDSQISLGESTFTLEEAFKAAWEQAKKFGTFLKDTLVGTIATMIASLGTLGSVVADALSGNWGNLHFEDIAKTFQDNKRYWTEAGQIAAGALGAGVADKVGQVADVVGGALTTAVDYWTGAEGAAIGENVAEMMFGAGFLSKAKQNFVELRDSATEGVKGKADEGSEAPMAANQKDWNLVKRVTEYANLEHAIKRAKEAQTSMNAEMAYAAENNTLTVYNETIKAQMDLYLEDLLKLQVQQEALGAMAAEGGVWNEFGVSVAKQLDGAADASAQFGKVMSDGFMMAGDALANFVATGEMDFKAFARSMVQMISQIIMKLMIMKALEGISGAGLGGISDLAGDMFKAAGGTRATGGPVGAGKPYLVGEKGPELFVPPSGGSIKNATATAGMAPQVNTTVVNVQDPSEIPAAMATSAGEEVILNVIQNNPEILRELS